RMGDGGLWDETDGFYYDWLRLPDGRSTPLRIRSLVGLIPLLAVTVITEEQVSAMPGFRRRMRWFIEHRPDLCRDIAAMTRQGVGTRGIMSMVRTTKLKRILTLML